MGTAVSRIEQEFILTAVFERRIPVRVHGWRQESDGQLVSVSGTEIAIDLESVIRTGREERLRVFFSYFGQVMTFNARVRSINEKQLVVAYPKSLYKNLQRKYERVPPPGGVSVYFIIQDAKVELRFPKTEEYNPADKPVYSDKFKADSIAQLIGRFRESIAARCSDNRITMFRDRVPQGFEEEIVARTGRMLLIPQVGWNTADLDESIRSRMITAAMMTRPDEQNIPESGRSYPALVQQKRANGIVAELYCPVLFHEYVVGYVYVVSRERAKEFHEELVNHVLQFADVLAYSLKANNYFEGAESASERYTAEIINLSASGMLFTNDSPKLRESLMIYADIPLVLQIGERRISTNARIMRKFEDSKTCYYGVQFLEVKPEDFRFLFDYVYGRQFTKEDNESWEGGTAPPPLAL